MTAPSATPAATLAGMHLPSLAVGLTIMLGATLNPRLLADAAGHADHALALAVFWAMSAGFVRGVGFVPRNGWIRWLLSGWACLAGLAMAACILLAR